MGARKRLAADQRKEEKKRWFGAILKDFPTSPRKMRLIANLIRGEEVNYALNILKYTKNHASIPLEKLVRSAIANWEGKNTGKRVEDAGLFVKEIFVDSARVLKRIRPAPQGTAHRIAKRSNHVTIVLGSNLEDSTVQEVETAVETEQQPVETTVENSTQS